MCGFTHSYRHCFILPHERKEERNGVRVSHLPRQDAARVTDPSHVQRVVAHQSQQRCGTVLNTHISYEQTHTYMATAKYACICGCPYTNTTRGLLQQQAKAQAQPQPDRRTRTLSCSARAISKKRLSTSVKEADKASVISFTPVVSVRVS